MKLNSPRKVKLKNGWSCDMFHIDYAYSGALEGAPSDKLNESIINSAGYFFKKYHNIGQNEINIAPRFNIRDVKAMNHTTDKLTVVKDQQVLKSLKLDTILMDDTDDNIAYVSTFLNEDEEVEDVLNEIVETLHFIKHEFMF